jgi:hypothetical protein
MKAVKRRTPASEVDHGHLFPIWNEVKRRSLAVTAHNAGEVPQVETKIVGKPRRKLKRPATQGNG